MELEALPEAQRFYCQFQPQIFLRIRDIQEYPLRVEFSSNVISDGSVEIKRIARSKPRGNK